MMINKNVIGSFRRKRVDKSGRPVVVPVKEPIDWFIEAMALLGLLVL